MPSENAERRPWRGTGALEIALGRGDTRSIATRAVIPPARRWGMPNFCTPCGRYHSRDYEDCERKHRYAADVGNWGGYDARDLGLAPHERDRCVSCQAVGA